MLTCIFRAPIITGAKQANAAESKPATKVSTTTRINSQQADTMAAPKKISASIAPRDIRISDTRSQVNKKTTISANGVSEKKREFAARIPDTALITSASNISNNKRKADTATDTEADVKKNPDQANPDSN